MSKLNGNAERRIINAECALYVCKVCRTKNGFEHQKWCSDPMLAPGCESCFYYDSCKYACGHPSHRKAVLNE